MSFSLFNIAQSSEISLERDKSFKKPSLSEKYEKMISELDDYQKKVVEAPLGESMSCVAGAGSGKTKTIISRAIKMVYMDKVDPTQLVLITFTNKAARELKERYHKFFEDQYPPGTEFPTPHISTIHSFCLQQIRRTFAFPRTILSEYHSFKLFKEVCRKVCTEFKEEDPDVSLLNRLYKIMQDMQASMDILFMAVPLFKRDGTLDSVVTWEQAEAEHPDIDLLELMPYSNLIKILTRNGKQIKKEDSKNVVWNYVCSTPLRYETWVEIIKRYLDEKYRSKSLDFGDMDFQYLLLMAQYPELRDKVHRKISHISMDECQDSTNNQFLAGVFSDKDSFSEFYKFRESIWKGMD